MQYVASVTSIVTDICLNWPGSKAARHPHVCAVPGSSCMLLFIGHLLIDVYLSLCAYCAHMLDSAVRICRSGCILWQVCHLIWIHKPMIGQLLCNVCHLSSVPLRGITTNRYAQELLADAK